MKASRGGAAVSHLFFADDILFFSEATEDQIDCIMEGLCCFCDASGQKISHSKLSILFSSNIPDHVRHSLIHRMGVPQATDLGKYLGHQILQHGRNNRANSHLLQRVRGHLEGWKTKCLSRAGRLTLAKSVINGMSTFQMQVQKLPMSVLKELDKCVHRCVWGEYPGERKTHLVSWDVLCRPKDRGGFGLRKAEGMNQALLAKLGWRMMTQGEELWSKIIRQKYGFNDDGPVTFKHKQRASPTWRGLEWASKLLCSGLRWRAVTGSRIRFWKDVWIDDHPLLPPNCDLPCDADADTLVKDMWISGCGWEWTRFGIYFLTRSC